jgi:rhamnulokinase
VVHTHSTLVNMITCCTKGPELARQLADEVIWIPEVDPGLHPFPGTSTGPGGLQENDRPQLPRAVLMQNHGLVICGDTPEEIREHTDWLVAAVRKQLASAGDGSPFGPVTKIDSAEARRLIQIVGPALRGLLATART